jgi:biotin carboxyl carrier protein
MSWRRFLILGLVAGLATHCVAAPPSADRKSPSKKGKSAPRSGASKTEEEGGTEPADSGTAGGPQPPTGQIVIHRQPLHLRAPEKYQVSMHLEPKQLIRIASPFDGTVKAVVRKPGQKVDTAAEIVRMDVTPKQLVLDRAKALYRAAQLEAESAGKGGAADVSIAKELVEARLQAAKAELDLAAYWVEQGTLRAPFPAEVFGVSIAEGQVVRMGEPLIVLGDTSALTVEIPVDRASTQVGQNLAIKVEDQTATGKVDALLPLSPRFESLRDLLPSAALASVTIKNSGGTLKAGQTVYSPLVPRDLIADVPNGCIGNVGDGGHKVQVLRDNTVRDVVVATLAPVGVDRSFVSGAFRDGDEVIESSSQELVDGTVVRSSPMALLKQTTGKPTGPDRHSAPAEKPAAERPSSGI